MYATHSEMLIKPMHDKTLLCICCPAFQDVSPLATSLAQLHYQPVSNKTAAEGLIIVEDFQLLTADFALYCRLEWTIASVMEQHESASIPEPPI